jgi:hypothetical protein
MLKKNKMSVLFYYKQEDEETVRLLEDILPSCDELLRNKYGLKAPKKCKVYITEKLVATYFFSQPFIIKLVILILAPITFPCLFFMHMNFKCCVAVASPSKRKSIIYIKPIRLLPYLEGIGRGVFNIEPDLSIKIQGAFCHELTHAYSSKLNLPSWLNEGIAMLAMDELWGKQSVKVDSLKCLSNKNKRPSISLLGMSRDKVSAKYAHCYWLTKYLLEEETELMKELLSKKLRSKKLERKISVCLHINRERLWEEISSLVYDFYSKEVVLQN